MHGRSDHVTHSLTTYLGARPQVPVIATAATDDDLLSECVGSCVDQGWFEAAPQNGDEAFRPLLQLSPTNAVQAHSAVMFASQRYKRRKFLIVTSSDKSDADYTKKMTAAYRDEITAAHAEFKGLRDMAALPSESDLRKLDPDCILYAGGNGEAQVLLSTLSGMNLKGMDLVIMLSDSVIDTRGTDSDLAVFASPAALRPAQGAHRSGHVVNAAQREELQPSTSKLRFNFTNQNDAMDYNSHNNAYAEDAFSIAQQLIADLNARGGDVRFWVKSHLHLVTAADARRNLASIMKENSLFHSAYVSSTPDRFYVFEGHKQYGGIFHVWRLKQQPTQPGDQMEDVDNWHIPRSFTVDIVETSAVQQP